MSSSALPSGTPPSAIGTTSSRSISRISGVTVPVLQAGHVEQVAHEVVEPVGALLDRLQELRPAPSDQATSSTQRGTWRP